MDLSNMTSTQRTIPLSNSSNQTRQKEARANTKLEFNFTLKMPLQAISKINAGWISTFFQREAPEPVKLISVELPKRILLQTLNSAPTTATPNFAETTLQG